MVRLTTEHLRQYEVDGFLVIENCESASGDVWHRCARGGALSDLIVAERRVSRGDAAEDCGGHGKLGATSTDPRGRVRRQLVPIPTPDLQRSDHGSGPAGFHRTCAR